MRSRGLRIGLSLPGATAGATTRGFQQGCVEMPFRLRRNASTVWRGLRSAGASCLERGDRGFPANAILVRGLSFAYY